jgi:hypothetical protein
MTESGADVHAHSLKACSTCELDTLSHPEWLSVQKSAILDDCGCSLLSLEFSIIKQSTRKTVGLC